MGIRYCNRSDLQCTFELWDQTVTLADWLEYVTRQFSSPDWPVGGRHLADLRSAVDISSIFDSDISEVSSLLEIYQERIAGLRLAIVEPPGSHKPSLFRKRMSELGVLVFVCQDLESACAWLGVNPTDAEGVFKELRGDSQRG